MTKLYTVKQASKILGFSTNTVYKYLNEGALKSSRASARKGRFRITQKSLEEFLGSPMPAETAMPVEIPQVETVALPEPVSVPYRPSFSLQATRVLLLLSFVLLVIEALTADIYSLNSQLLRLSTLIILFLLAYQFGRKR